MSLAERIALVNEKIAAAARQAGREPSEVTLVAATKVQTSDTIRQAIAAGVTICGENRVQEMTAHLEEDAYAGAELHFIGHLQRNKVKQVVGHVALIQSVGSLELLDEIEKVAAARGLVQDILVEINIGEETSKSGVDADSLFPLLEAAAAKENLRLRGLMAIPPADADDNETRRFFARMRELLAKADAQHYDRAQMDILSMGMSHDYAAAIAEGATIVRVGTAIYGARDYSKKA